MKNTSKLMAKLSRLKIKKYQGLISLLAMILSVLGANAQDWPQFLGPNGNSTSQQKNIIRTWPQTGPQVLWSVNIGIGYGGTVVKEGKIYLLDRNDNTGDKMRCFELATGKELWNFEYAAAGSFPFPGSRSVPAIDDKNVYSCGPLGDLYCIDINTHKPVWNKNIWKDFGGQDLPQWAITQCPLLFGDLVIVASQTPEAGVVAYEKQTGNLKWKTPSLGNAGYASPVVINVANEKQIVMVGAAGGGWGAPPSGGKVVGIDPNSGKILWEYGGFQCSIPSNPAIEAGDSKILIAGGYNAGSAMLKIEKKANGTYAANELFKTADFGAHTLPPVLVNGYFYVHYGTNERRDGLVCMSMDGQIKWKSGRSPEFNKGSMIYADGLLLATDGAKKLFLIEPDPTAFKPIASSESLKPGGVDTSNGMTNFGGPTQNWAPIALADGKLIIRDQSQLFCVKVAE